MKRASSTEELKLILDEEMGNIVNAEYLELVLTPGFVDKRIYAIYLIETYHYTYHNARNQALVATRPECRDIRYMKYCLKHALDEAGHELMALHDLKKSGYFSIDYKEMKDSDLPKPLMATEILIAYLYRVSTTGNPLTRLGYSFWAERIYEYLSPLMAMFSQLGVEKSAMTFLVDHSVIDAEHAIEVDRAINMFAKTPQDWEDIEDCMKTSLRLKAKVMDAVFEEFVKLKKGTSDRYNFLNK
jgi:hypothetical protein